MRHTAAFILVVITFASGCATTMSERARRVQEGDDRTVASCTFIGTVTGSSSVGGVAHSTGRANAITEALEDAASRDATHIIWQQVDSGFSGAEARGRAYKCTASNGVP